MSAQSLAAAHDALYSALNVMLSGDAGPIHALWSHGDDATYAGPFGGYFVGSVAIAEEFARAAALHLGGRIETTDVHMVSGADMGYTTCVEHGIDHVIEGERVSIAHRATNVFRREQDGWRLVHHHTDESSSGT
jgi:ketosteroid isomerase-like protein